MKQDIGLKEMVVALRKELLDAQQEAAEQDLKFKIEEIEMEVALVTSKAGKGKGGVKFLVYNADLEGSLSKTQTHRLRLKLKPEGDTLLISREDSKE
jgi:hypothetical protein